LPDTCPCRWQELGDEEKKGEEKEKETAAFVSERRVDVALGRIGRQSIHGHYENALEGFQIWITTVTAWGFAMSSCGGKLLQSFVPVIPPHGVFRGKKPDQIQNWPQCPVPSAVWTISDSSNVLTRLCGTVVLYTSILEQFVAKRKFKTICCFIKQCTKRVPIVFVGCVVYDGITSFDHVQVIWTRDDFIDLLVLLSHRSMLRVVMGCSLQATENVFRN
jgi:hypothetical protein